ncbi:MAG: hypothetical protein US51_C0029G0003 [Microgenomates group bacterium GW2011_GWA2_37_6]|nr:MAG: hypothetical protein US51_C0029G0003 [Microgenomates group bacterium GW2011_GWA2_37_6]
MSESEIGPKPYSRDHASQRILEGEEFAGLRTWYEERLVSFPEYTVTDANLTDGTNWKAALTVEGQVEFVDGAFFTLKGQRITITKPDRSTFGWDQPGLIQKEGKVTVETDEGAEEITASGFVGVVKDADGNILLTLGQEPFAKTPKNVLARTPIQTSASKLASILDGDTAKDAAMYEFMSTVTGSEDVSGFFAAHAQDMFPPPYADANRIQATNIGFTTTISDPAMREAVTKNGQNRWCTPNEVARLAKAGILNGHTAAAVLAAS